MGGRLNGNGERGTGSVGPDDPTGVGVSLRLCCGERPAWEETVEEPPSHGSHGESPLRSAGVWFSLVRLGFPLAAQRPLPVRRSLYNASCYFINEISGMPFKNLKIT